MKICYVLKVLFFVWIYSSFVLVNEGVNVVLSDFDILLVAFMVLSDFTIFFFDELVKS